MKLSSLILDKFLRSGAVLSTAGGWWPVLGPGLVMNNADGWSPANIVMVVTRGVACPLL